MFPTLKVSLGATKAKRTSCTYSGLSIPSWSLSLPWLPTPMEWNSTWHMESGWYFGVERDFRGSLSLSSIWKSCSCWRYLSLLPTLCFQKLLLSRNRFPNIHYIGIDRPDAVLLYSYSSFPLFLNNTDPNFFWHTTGDFLHIMTGAGVIEGWTQYIFIIHYLWNSGALNFEFFFLVFDFDSPTRFSNCYILLRTFFFFLVHRKTHRLYTSWCHGVMPSMLLYFS